MDAREAAWRAYARSIALQDIGEEALENAEIDFKAGFEAAMAILSSPDRKLKVLRPQVVRTG
ncbi:hypothetical protein ACPW96_20755 [Micromonospora sp. DT81.3]|uniref:hypothetical protein n=1 Tax=Actinomycetes TaxID=1760 RepID=UPI003CFB968F